MKILLPPSETKHPDGQGRALDLQTLALPALRPEREAAVDALLALCGDEDAAARTLRLSPRQREEIAHNTALRTSGTLPAVERYTGVLYDALGVQDLDAAARRWLGGHVLIHSALFGPVGALDRIPRYRLSAGTSLPGLPPLRRHWADATSAALVGEPFILDLRSEGYVALGPVPASVRSAFVRVVTAEGRALNHFNKQAKGELVRTLAQHRPRVRTGSGLLDWAAGHDVPLRTTADPRVWELVAAETGAPRDPAR